MKLEYKVSQALRDLIEEKIIVNHIKILSIRMRILQLCDHVILLNNGITIYVEEKETIKDRMDIAMINGEKKQHQIMLNNTLLTSNHSKSIYILKIQNNIFIVKNIVELMNKRELKSYITINDLKGYPQGNKTKDIKILINNYISEVYVCNK